MTRWQASLLLGLLALSHLATGDAQCGYRKFACGDGQCIDANEKCNGGTDCSDGSDELASMCDKAPSVRMRVGDVVTVRLQFKEEHRAVEVLLCDDSSCSLLLASGSTLDGVLAYRVYTGNNARGDYGSLNSETPSVFMTDDSTAEKPALQTVWPGALQFLCHFHVAQSEWRWLLEAKNGVSKGQRQDLIHLFRQIMYSMELQELEDAILSFEEQCTSAKYSERVNKFLERKKEWVKLFRSNVTHRGHQKNNYAEATIRILKDIVLSRTKAFNVVAMVEFVTDVWECYFENKLLHFTYGQKAGPRLKYDNLCERMPEHLQSRIVRLEGGTSFQVPSATSSDLKYEVDTKVGWCSCPNGKSGSFCKHQALVHSKFGGCFPNCPAIDAKGRFRLGWLALGDKCPSFEFFIGLKEKISKEELIRIKEELNKELQQHSGEGTNPEEDVDINGDTEMNQNETDVLEPTPLQEGLDPQLQSSLDKAAVELHEQLNRIHGTTASSESAEVYLKALNRLTQRLKQVKNGAQAVTAIIRMSRAVNAHIKKCGRINVQPTATARRKPRVPEALNAFQEEGLL